MTYLLNRITTKPLKRLCVKTCYEFVSSAWTRVIVIIPTLTMKAEFGTQRDLGPPPLLKYVNPEIRGGGGGGNKPIISFTFKFFFTTTVFLITDRASNIRFKKAKRNNLEVQRSFYCKSIFTITKTAFIFKSHPNLIVFIRYAPQIRVTSYRLSAFRDPEKEIWVNSLPKEPFQ